MDIKEVAQYWLEESEEALKVADHLFEKGDYSYSLFFGHLSIEKLLKAIYSIKNKKHAPAIHNLNRLADLANIELPDNISDKMIEITTFNIEARYPDIKRSFRKICTKEFTEKKLNEIKEIYRWLQNMIKQ